MRPGITLEYALKLHKQQWLSVAKGQYRFNDGRVADIIRLLYSTLGLDRPAVIFIKNGKLESKIYNIVKESGKNITDKVWGEICSSIAEVSLSVRDNTAREVREKASQILSTDYGFPKATALSRGIVMKNFSERLVFLSYYERSPEVIDFRNYSEIVRILIELLEHKVTAFECFERLCFVEAPRAKKGLLVY